MSQITNFNSGGSGGSGIISIAADQGGSVVGPNTGILYSGGGGSTVYTYVAGNQIFINATDSDFNTMFGLNTGGAFAQQSGNGNVGFGYAVLPLLSTGNDNSIVGSQAGSNITTQDNNVGIGSQVLNGTGNNNIAIGASAMQNTDISGSNFISIGFLSSLNYGVLGETNNILLGGIRGTQGESNVMRLGHDGSTSVLGGSNPTTKTVIWGINGATGLGTTAPVVIDTTTGQLGVGSGGGGLTTLTTNGAQVATEVGGNINIFTGLLNAGIGDSLTATASGDTVTIGLGDVINMGDSTNTVGLYRLGSSVFMHNFTGGGSNPRNTFIGNSAGNQSATSGGGNVGIGNSALTSLTTGGNNTGLGANSLATLNSGSNNLCLGLSSGNNYTTESSNIIIGNTPGTVADSRVMRMGNFVGSPSASTTLTTYVAGVSGVTVANAQPVYMNTATGQIGTNPGAWIAFTPTIEGETSAGTTTYGIQTGRYIRQGNTIIAQFSMAISAATGTGNVLIGGFPFAISASATQSPLGPLAVGGLTWPALTTQVASFGIAGATTARILCSGSATTATFMQMANITFSVNGTAIYEV